jgi:hypothetical protein
VPLVSRVNACDQAQRNCAGCARGTSTSVFSNLLQFAVAANVAAEKSVGLYGNLTIHIALHFRMLSRTQSRSLSVGEDYYRATDRRHRDGRWLTGGPRRVGCRDSDLSISDQVTGQTTEVLFNLENNRAAGETR